MDLLAEEKTLLWNLQSVLVKIGTRYAGEHEVFPTLDDACHDWLRYRATVAEKDPSVDNLELSVRVDNAMHNLGVHTIAQFRKLTVADFKRFKLSKANWKDSQEALAEWDAKQKGKS